MISVRNRDARKGLGLGFGGVGVGRDMEENELEEGEACSYNNNDDYDASMDPDIALSYLDEKLQDVLGHFQKDFEGGVSAENLGAKFGGYGSFLPAYQRSPVWSHPRTPPKVQNSNASRSPNSLPVEGGRHSSTVLSTVSQSVRPGPASSSSTSLRKTSSLNDSVKQEICNPLSRAEEFVYKHEVPNKKTANIADQKSLKVRIKVGLDNFPTQKNAAIYSGLGLDVSPSSSLDDSPSESEGMQCDPLGDAYESPTSILKIMTSYPLCGDNLVSPLPDNLIYLSEREIISKESKPVHLPERGPESSLTGVNGSGPGKGDRKVPGEKKAKLAERMAHSGDQKSGSKRDVQNAIGVVSKEFELDTMVCEELVSKTLKLPLLSNSCSTVDDTGKSNGRAPHTSKEASTSVMRGEVFANGKKVEQWVPSFNQDVDWVENPMTTAENVREDKKGTSVDDMPALLGKDGQTKGGKARESAKADSNFPKGKKVLKDERMDSSKQELNQRTSSLDIKKKPQKKEHSSSGAKKKSKGGDSDAIQVTEAPKESLRVGSTSVPKNKKSTDVDGYPTERVLEECKLEKDIGKAEDRYREFFGDIVESEQEENRLNSLDMHVDDMLKDSEVLGKTSINNTSKERPGGKKIGHFSASEAYPIAPPNVAPASANGTITGVAQPAFVPVEMNENWVCCDMCQKWRLLPRGTNTENLPDNWLCSMLDWLPGMNRCSFSEEETTNALRAYYQVPASESQNNLHRNPGSVVSGVTSADSQHPDRNHQSFGPHALPSGGKKKLGSKEILNATNKDGRTQLSNSMKKNMQASTRSGQLNDVNQYSLVNDADFRQPSKSNDLPMEKHRQKQKEKHKTLDQCSDAGNIRSSKVKGKGDPGLDSFRASKKIKTESSHFAEEEKTSDLGGDIGIGAPNLSNGFPAASATEYQARHKDHSSSKDSKSDTKDRIQVSAKKTKDKGQVSLHADSLVTGNCDNRDVIKKRKAKESHDAQIYAESLPILGNHLQVSKNFVKEDFSENDYRKVKKVRVSKSEGKESSASKGSGKQSKRSGHTKNQQLGQDLGSTISQRSLDGIDLLKRDFGSAQPSVAATSSSSKVSGSHKTKASFHEVKGSPVESVSSSPLRIPNSDKLATTRSVKGKDDSRDAGLFAMGSPRRCSDGEDDGGSDRSGAARKETTFTLAHRGPQDSPLLDVQDKNFNHLSSDKSKVKIVPSPDLTNRHFNNGVAGYLVQDTCYPSQPKTSDEFHDEERQNENFYHASGSRPKKSGQESTSRSKDKNRSIKSDSINGSQDRAHSYELKAKDGRKKVHEKFGDKLNEDESHSFDKKHSAEKLSNESSKRETQSNFPRNDGPDAKVDVICSQDVPTQNPAPAGNDERSSKKLLSDKTGHVETVKGQSQSLAPASGALSETLARCPRPVSGSHRSNGAETLAVDSALGDDTLKVPKQVRKDQNGTQHHSSRHPTMNGHKMRDVDAPSPVRKDPSSQAASNAMKEAKDLKHRADRLKHAGSNVESTWLYFQAALKFLHGASLLESCSSDSTKNGEMIQSMQTYSSTAKLCEFCAHEYEKSKDMAAAALAYKCMEVAYMRVIFSSHGTASRDRLDLQKALQIAPPGESPSSSASDVDNLNHPTTADKTTYPKCVSSPQVAGNHVIAAKNRSNFVRLLNFAQDVNFAMEASRKSRSAFAAASISFGEGQHGKGISSIKTALDFNFHDVEGLLRLVRLAMDAISR